MHNSISLCLSSEWKESQPFFDFIFVICRPPWTYPLQQMNSRSHQRISTRSANMFAISQFPIHAMPVNNALAILLVIICTCCCSSLLWQEEKRRRCKTRDLSQSQREYCKEIPAVSLTRDSYCSDSSSSFFASPSFLSFCLAAARPVTTHVALRWIPTIPII